MLKRFGILLLAALVSACGGGSDASFDNGNTRLLTAIEVSPAEASIAVGMQQEFSATGVYSDGSREDLTTRASWASADAAIASVDSAGVATGLATGTTSISASLDGVSGAAELTVSEAVAQILQILPPAASIPVNTTQDYRAYAVYSDGSVENVTFSAEWTLENDSGILAAYEPGAAPVSREIDDFGTAIGVAVGEDELVASFAGLTSTSSITVTEAVLESLSVTPRDEATPEGTLVAYTATGNYSDGSTANLTKVVTWSSSDPGVATISNSDPTRGLAAALAPGASDIIASFEGLSDQTSLTVLDDNVVRIDVLPPQAVIDVGQSLQYTAIAITETGRSLDITSGADWGSQNEAVATIDEGGSASGSAPGTTAITASYDGVTGTAQLAVRGAEIDLVAITVEPINAALYSFTTLQYTATAIYSDGSNADVTELVTWGSLDRTILVLSNDDDFGRGLAFGLQPGETDVTAELDGVSGSTPVTVVQTQAEIELVVRPALIGLPVGASVRYSADLVIDGERAIDVSEFVGWSSSEPGVASVDATGLARALAEGTALIVAELGLPGLTLEGSGQLNVRPAPPEILELAVTPVNASVIEGGQQQYQARAIYSDGTTEDVSDDVQWSTGDGGIAVVDTSGLATGVSAGTTSINAILTLSSGDISGAANLQVLPPALTGLTVTPPSATTLPEGQVQFTATAEFENGTTEDVSDSVSWLSSDPTVAQVDSRGLATGLNPGAVDIQATLATPDGTFSDAGRLRVNTPAVVIEELVVDPAAAEVLVGGKQQFNARVLLSDGSSQDVTTQVSWTSENSAIASVNDQGRATGIAEGNAGITASLTYEAVTYTDTAALEVTAAAVTIEELIVDPASASVLIAGTQQFSARVILSDGSSQDVTTDVGWSSSDSSIAQVDADGLATGLGEGHSEIVATLLYEGVTFSDAGRLTVEAPPVSVEEVRVQPPTATVIIGGTQQFSAEVVLSDGRVIDVTRDASWQSADSDIATVNGSGLATGVAEGATRVIATIEYDGDSFSGSGALTVTPPAVTVEELVVSPARATVLVDGTQAFTARAVLSDGSEQDVTDEVSWSSSDTQVASVDATGLARGLTAGASNIIARLDLGDALLEDSGRLRVEDAAPTVTAVRVEPVSSDILVNTKQQFLAFAELSNGEEIDVTRDVSWNSTDEDIAHVNGNGRATGLRAGSVDIVATLALESGSLTDSGALTVLPPPVTVLELRISPETAEVLIEGTVQYSAVAVLSDGSEPDVTEDVNWRSGNSSIAQIDSSGLATGLAEGNTNIRATLIYGDGQSIEDSAALAVKAPTVVVESIDVAPSSASVFVDGEQRYTATARLSDGSSLDVSRDVTWRSAPDDIAAVNRSGLATGLAAGVATISASLPTESGPVSDDGELIVEERPPELTGLEVYPPVVTMPLGTTQDFRAVAFFDDGSRENVTFAGTWSLSNDPPILERYDPADRLGLGSLDDFGTALSINLGIDDLTIEYLGEQASSRVEVVEAELVSITISPRDERVPVGTVTAFTADGVFTDGTSKDITDSVTWASSDPDVAIISNTSPTRGAAQALAVGDTTISATLGAVSDSTRLRVNSDPVVRIDVLPAQQTIDVGGSQQYQAIAVLTSGETEDVTFEASWTSSDGTVASINDLGLAQGLGAGDSTIGATFEGISGSAQLTVQDIVSVVSVVVDPPLQVLITLQTQQYTATAIYSDNSSRDVTDEVVWSVVDTSVARISNSAFFGNGLAIALLPGETSVVARLQVDESSVEGSASLQVLPPPTGIEKLEVNPPLANIVVGETQQYEAILVLTDGGRIDVSQYATWTSSDSSIASVNAGGLAHGEAPGDATITARLFGTDISGNASLTVRDEITVDAVVVSPPLAEVLEGGRQQYTAVAQLSDGNEVDVTDDVDWTTGNNAIAVISEAGEAEGVAAGSTAVIATLDVNGLIVRGAAQITVLPAITVEAVVVSPPLATLLVEGTQQYSAEVRLSDGRVIEVTGASWTSSDKEVAQINSDGLATALTPGQTQITATVKVDGEDFSGDATLIVEALTVDKIVITPQQANALVGDSRQFTATAVMSNGSTQDVTHNASWFVTNEAVASIESGQNAGLATGLGAGTTRVYVEYLDNGALVPCEEVPSCRAQFSVEEPGVTEIVVTPAVSEVIVAEKQQYRATAILENGDSVDVTDSVSWRSSDTAIASVNTDGLATGLSVGEVRISAALDDDGTPVEGDAELSVLAPPVTIEDIRVTPENETILLGDTLQYTATALLSDGSAVDVTDASGWESSDTSIASVNGSGLATGLSAGEVTVTANLKVEGTVYSGSTSLTVEEPLTITAIQVTPKVDEILAGNTLQYTATAVLSDLSTRDVTSQSIWFTSDAGIATAEQGANAGRVTGQAEGTASIWAEFTFEGTTYPCQGEPGCEATLRVTEPVTAVRIDVTPQTASVLIDDTQQYRAELVLSDNTVIDITDSAAWRSSDIDVARLQAPNGLFIGIAEGTAAVFASGDFDGTTLDGSAELIVEPPAVVVERIEVVPASASVFVGDSGTFEAFAYLSNGEVLDVSLESVWRSSDTSVGVIDPGTGFAEAIAAGSTQISASFDYNGDISTGTSDVTVTEAQPDLLEVAPVTAAIAVGDEQQYVATLHYEDGREEPVTDSVNWSAGDTDIAVVSNAQGSEGLATALAEGNTRIIATHGSGLTGEGSLDVIPPTLVALEVDPASLDLVEGESDRLFALATFSDESVLDVSAEADWSSDDNATVSVGNGVDNGGVISGNQPGNATVTARYEGLDAVSAISVAANSLVNGWIEPGSNTMEVGQEEDYRAFGEFLDDSSREITDEVIWQTSDPAVATVGNGSGRRAAQPKGRVLALSTGNADISALFEGAEVDSSPLTVTPRTATALTVKPDSALLVINETAALRSVATYADGSDEDVTDKSIWSSSDSDVAVVGNRGDTAGVVTATGLGSATVSAAFDGLEADSLIQVADGDCSGKPTSIVIDSGDQVVQQGQTVRFTARATYPDGCSQDVTESNQTVWQSQDKKICDFESPKGGIATGLSVGVATVEVKHRGVNSTATCTVIAREDCDLDQNELPDFIYIVEAKTVAPGEQAQFEARAVWRGGACETDVTRSPFLQWRTLNGGEQICSIVPQTGVATGKKDGVSDIEAAYNGGRNDQSTCTVESTPSPGTCGPEWQVKGASYVIGDIVSFEGQNYECRQSHTTWGDPNWAPPNTPALWTPVGACN